MVHTAAMTATHGRLPCVHVVKIFGALLCTTSPYRMRDAEKTIVFTAEKAAVINTTLTMKGELHESMKSGRMSDPMDQ